MDDKEVYRSAAALALLLMLADVAKTLTDMGDDDYGLVRELTQKAAANQNALPLGMTAEDKSRVVEGSVEVFSILQMASQQLRRHYAKQTGSQNGATPMA